MFTSLLEYNYTKSIQLQVLLFFKYIKFASQSMRSLAFAALNMTLAELSLLCAQTQTQTFANTTYAAVFFALCSIMPLT